ncbi:MAG: glycine cleavage system aminomethyltransferase GcvT [Pseudomonadota bacterium]
METKKTTLFESLEKQGGKMVPFAGYYLPIKFISELKEHKNVRDNAGLFEVSHMGEIFILGKNALNFCQFITSNDVSLLKNQDVQYTVILNENACAVDDATLFKFNDEKYMFCVNAANIDKDYNHFLSYQDKFENVIIENKSECTDMLACQGPKSKKILQKLTDYNLDNLSFFTFASMSLAGVEVVVSRTGYTGELGYEITARPEKTKHLFSAIMEAGQEHELQLIGLGARDTLRLEMGMILYGNDLDETKTPIEASLRWCTKADKPEFLGKDIITKQLENKPKIKLVGLEMIDRGIPRQGCKILWEDTEVGYVTSGSFSPTLGYGIAMAYIDSSFYKIGRKFKIDIRGKKLVAKTTKFPFINTKFEYKN